MQKYKTFALAMCTTISCIGVCGQQADTWIDDASRVIANVNQDFATSLAGRLDWQWESYPPRDRFSSDITVYYGSSGGCRSKWTIDRTNGIETVHCTNSVYRFHLKRPISPGSNWTLVALDYVPRENKNWFLDTTLREKKDEYIIELAHRSPFVLFHSGIVEVFKLPSFVCTNFSKDETGKVKAKCSYDEMESTIDASIEFDSVDWRVNFANLNIRHRSSGMERTWIRSYKYGNGQFPVVVDQTVKLVNSVTLDDGEELPAGSLLSKYDSQFFPDDVRQKNAADFRLSFFGLPEPDDVRWGWPPAVWISLSGVLLLGIVVWRRSRRSNAA